MNDAIRELLLKTRKGSTAQFETKQWKEVLEALGAQVQVEKTRNTITKVVVQVPDFSDIHGIQGFTLVIEKDPRHRRISFYQLGSFLKDSGFSLVALASKALGLDTPEEEKRLRNLYERDLTNTGTCSICDGNFKRTGTVIGHHGFKRPGDGMLHGTCFGVGYLPWECSSVGAMEYIAQVLEPTKAHAEKRLEMLTTGQITEFMELPPSWKTNTLPETITKELDPERFARKLDSEIGQTERYIAMLTADIKRFRAKVAGWAPDELPEFKHAGKFKTA